MVASWPCILHTLSQAQASCIRKEELRCSGHTEAALRRPHDAWQQSLTHDLGCCDLDLAVLECGQKAVRKGEAPDALEPGKLPHLEIWRCLRTGSAVGAISLVRARSLAEKKPQRLGFFPKSRPSCASHSRHSRRDMLLMLRMAVWRKAKSSVAVPCCSIQLVRAALEFLE